MPKCQCAIVGCHNGTYRLDKWRKTYCEIHNINHGTGCCICKPPFKLFPFPSEVKDPEGRKQWIANVNRIDTQTGQIWQPTSDSRIRSLHFLDGIPTQMNPYPTLHMGYVSSRFTKRPRRLITKIEGPKTKKMRRSIIPPSPIQEISSPNINIEALEMIYEEEVETDSVTQSAEESVSLNEEPVCKEDHTYCLQMQLILDHNNVISPAKQVVKSVKTKCSTTTSLSYQLLKK